MGHPAQERIVRRIDLERFLSRVKTFQNPSVKLEQYAISEKVAGMVLFLAAYVDGNIVNKRVIDLGCGTGRLALGAAFLGAEHVVGVDIDKTAIKIATENSIEVGLKNRVSWINGVLDVISGKFDTVLQNPPFGVQKKRSDREFLNKALESGTVIYSLHNHPFDKKEQFLKIGNNDYVSILPSAFLKRYVEKMGGKVENVYSMPMVIPKIFDFHTKSRHQIIVDLYVIKKT